MITGIDETGDFGQNSKEFNFFVAVHIDQNLNKVSLKESQFNIWEGSITNEYKSQQGEVKGQLLRDQHLADFYKTVLSKDPKILYSVVRIIPAENPVEIFEDHKKYELAQFEDVIKRAEEKGHKNWAEGYKQILYWYKNKNYNIHLKIKCLEHLLGLSVNRVLGWSQLSFILDNEDESNFKDMLFKIDKDFIKAENTKVLWNEIFRQFWQNFSKRNPLPMVNVWSDEKHPVNRHFQSKGENLIMGNLFTKKTHFVDSKDSWEVRVADIVGTILHRSYNHKRCTDLCQELEKQLGKKQQNYMHLQLKNLRE